MATASSFGIAGIADGAAGAGGRGAGTTVNTAVLFVGTVLTALYVMRQFMTLLLSVIALGALYYAWKRSRKVSETHEPFIDIFRVDNTVNEPTVPCNVYYTGNMKECDANMYFQTSQEIEKKLRSPYLKKHERESLLRVKADMDEKRLPFAHVCKTRFGTWKQTKSAPPKNASSAGAAHGAPATYAYCFHDREINGMKEVRMQSPVFSVNGRPHQRFDFNTLDFDKLKSDFCSQYVVPQQDLQHLSTFQRKWILGLKVDLSTGTIQDIRSLTLNYQDMVPFSNTYQALRTLFQIRLENGNAVIGANPETYTVLRLFRNHCGKIARATSTNVVLKNVLPSPKEVLMTGAQIANSYGINMQELINDIDAPINFNMTCPFRPGVVRCAADGRIYMIENRQKRYFTSVSYDRHQRPPFVNVDCTMLNNYCPYGANMREA